MKSAFFAFVILAISISACHAQTEVFQMVSNEQGRNDYFGNSVVASSDHLFVRERDGGEIVFYQYDRLTGQSLDIIALSDVTTGDYGWLQDAKSNLALFGSGFSNSLYGQRCSTSRHRKCF